MHRQVLAWRHSVTVYWILHTEVDLDMLNQDLQILGGKKLGKTLSLPSFFYSVAALSKILIASSGFYIHKIECANSAAYK